MDYSGAAAVGAGVLATVIMTIPMYMGLMMMPRQMPMNILYLLGSMMTPARGPAYVMGAMMHLGMGIVFALIHTGIYQALDLASNLAAWGILFGFVHWIVVGMGLGMMRVMHPLVKKGELQDPGAFATGYPPMTVMGFLMLHLLFGLLVDVFYEAWA